MKLRNRLLAVLLALALVLALPGAALAAEFPAETGQLVEDYTGKTVILHSNDVHGAIEGYAYIAQLKKDLQARGAEVILVDAGDFSQGTRYVSASKGAAAVEMMNAVGYDVATIGNHEFDYGYDQLKENLEKAEFTLVCANVLQDGEPILNSDYIIENDATVRDAARRFGVSKSTVHKDITERLREIDRLLYEKVRLVLEQNKAERHLRGGDATRRKYQSAGSRGE